MTRDVILIHETLAEGRTENISEVSAQNVASFAVWISLAQYHGPHRFECCDRAEHGVHSGGEGGRKTHITMRTVDTTTL